MKDDDYPAVETTPEAPDAPAPRQPEFGQPKPSHSKRWLLISGIVVAVLLLAGVGYWFLLRDSEPAPQPQANTQEQDEEEEQLGNAPQANATTQTFKSESLKLEFSYRSDWTLKESADDSEIILTSPQTSYVTKDGESKDGVFTLKLRNGAIPEAQQATVQAAYAVKDSEVIAYDAPTKEQRHYTNLSFAGPDASTFGMVIVSGSVAYKAGQPLGSQINLFGNAYLFAGGYGTDPEDSLTFESVSATSFDSTAYQQAVAIIKSLKLH